MKVREQRAGGTAGPVPAPGVNPEAVGAGSSLRAKTEIHRAEERKQQRERKKEIREVEEEEEQAERWQHSGGTCSGTDGKEKLGWMGKQKRGR